MAYHKDQRYNYPFIYLGFYILAVLDKHSKWLSLLVSYFLFHVSLTVNGTQFNNNNKQRGLRLLLAILDKNSKWHKPMRMF
jgi:hypothetical protein